MTGMETVRANNAINFVLLLGFFVLFWFSETGFYYVALSGLDSKVEQISLKVIEICLIYIYIYICKCQGIKLINKNDNVKCLTYNNFKSPFILCMSLSLEGWVICIRFV